MNNIFVLNHLAQRGELRGGKKEKVHALFVNLKVAFDTINRDGLMEILEEKGINKKIVKKIRKIYEEMTMTIRTSKGYTNIFRMQKGVRQECILSSLLFDMYIADINR